MERTQFFLLLYFFTLPLLAINPVKEYKMKPADYRIAAKEEKISVGGAVINAWVMRSAAKRRKQATILIVGSDAGNMGYSLPYAYHFLQAGYDVVTFDYRGFGESSDFEHNSANVYHREYIQDFVAALRFAKRWIPDNRIVVSSFSMGTLVAAAGHAEEDFDALVAEGMVAFPKRIVERAKLERDKVLLLPEGFAKDVTAMNALKTSVLLFSADEDTITTLQDAEEFARDNPDRKVIRFSGDHLKGAAVLGFRDYVQKITDFLES